MRRLDSVPVNVPAANAARLRAVLVEVGLAAGSPFRSVHAPFGRCPLQIPETDPQEIRGGDQQKYFALFHGQSQSDQCASHADHGVTRHDAEVRPLTPSESLSGYVEAFLGEPPNCGVGSIRFVVIHA